jgi:hypothetical protein
MKYVFYFLLLCNVVFLLWATGVGREKSNFDRYEISLPAQTERIALIQEQSATEKKAPQAETAPELEAAPPPPTDQPKPEAVQSPAEDSQVPGAQAQADVFPPPSDNSCFRLGPYRSAAAARQALAGLNSRIEQGRLVSRYDQVADGFWVLYPKAENLDVARINRNMLASKGVRDLWLIDKGEMQGAISLGIFKTRERAEDLQRKFVEQDIQVEVKPHMIRAKASWLQFRWPGARAELDAAVAGLTSEQPTVQELRIEPCD